MAKALALLFLASACVDAATPDETCVVGQPGCGEEAEQEEVGMLQARAAQALASAHGPSLLVWILRARNLSDTDGFWARESDPYCVVYRQPGDIEVLRTPVVEENEDPDWDLGPMRVNVSTADTGLKFVVLDSDFNYDDLIGEALIPREELKTALHKNLTLKLREGGARGSINVKIIPFGLAEASPAPAPPDTRPFKECMALSRSVHSACPDLTPIDASRTCVYDDRCPGRTGCVEDTGCRYKPA